MCSVRRYDFENLHDKHSETLPLVLKLGIKVEQGFALNTVKYGNLKVDLNMIFGFLKTRLKAAYRKSVVFWPC